MKIDRTLFRAVLGNAENELNRGRDGWLTLETELLGLISDKNVFDVPKSGRQLLVACHEVVYLLQYLHDPKAFAKEHPKDVMSKIIVGTTHGEMMIIDRIKRYVKVGLLEARRAP